MGPQLTATTTMPSPHSLMQLIGSLNGHARQRFERKLQAATRIQAAYRAHRVRAKQAAAARIQAAYIGYTVRAGLRRAEGEMGRAITKLQALTRGRRPRSHIALSQLSLNDTTLSKEET